MTAARAPAYASRLLAYRTDPSATLDWAERIAWHLRDSDRALSAHELVQQHQDVLLTVNIENHAAGYKVARVLRAMEHHGLVSSERGPALHSPRRFRWNIPQEIA